LASATSWCVPATVPNYTSAAQTRCSPFAFACVRVVYVVAAVDAVSSHSVVPVWQVRITVITVWATVSTAHSGPSHCAALYIALWERTLQRTQCYRTSAAVLSDQCRSAITVECRRTGGRTKPSEWCSLPEYSRVPSSEYPLAHRQRSRTGRCEGVEHTAALRYSRTYSL
jgi:hypothetical protein